MMPFFNYPYGAPLIRTDDHVAGKYPSRRVKDVVDKSPPETHSEVENEQREYYRTAFLGANMNERETEKAIDTNGSKKVFEETASGGQKETAGKTRLDLIPLLALEEVGRVYSAGAVKYAEHNWRKGLLFMAHNFGAALRHMFKWAGGQDTDEETNTHHLANATFHLLAIIEQSKRGRTDLDDRIERRTDV